MTDVISSTPSELLRRRLDDPQTAAALAMLLDNAEVVAMLVGMVDGVLRRSETIGDNLATSLGDVKKVGGSFEFLVAPTKRMVADAPAIADAAEALLESGMLRREVVATLGQVAGSALDGLEAAKVNGTTVGGPVTLLKAMRDPDVARGIGMVIEVARALGRSLGADRAR